MTEQERTELLRKVAECAPKEMDCFLMVRGNAIMFGSSRVNFYLNLRDGDDQWNATAIIAMLDAMEKAGWVAALYPDFRVPPGFPLKYFVKLKLDADGITKLATVHGGKTRAEAVSRAFVSVFGEKG